ncbi:MAG: DNA polymerase III subunit delta [Anaeroplasmataceae bacterium]|nr:DNA polymerase III subunit delta [Anaeroplasmataceae bacterium]
MASNFIILADDVLAVEQKITEIKKGMEYEEEPILYNLMDEGTYALVDELSTISLFETTKFIIAKNAECLLNKADKAFVELLKVMNAPSNQNILVLVFMGAIDFSSEQYQKLKRFSSVFEIRNKNINLEEYASQSFLEEGFTVEADAIKLLTSYSNSLSQLRNYMDQLECYKALEKKITSDDVTYMVPEPLDDNIYALIDAVLANNKKLMLKGFTDLKLRSLQASNLVTLLINKFQEIYNVHILIHSGMNQANLSEIFHISSGRAYYMIKNAKEYTLSTIQKQLEELNRLDYNIKTGKIDQNIGLELYFLNI